VARLQAAAAATSSQAPPLNNGPPRVVAVKVDLEPVKFRHTKKGAAAAQGGATEAGGEACAICLAPLAPADVVNELDCGHCYHRECLTAWVHVQPNCPSCRAPVVGRSPGAPPHQGTTIDRL